MAIRIPNVSPRDGEYVLIVCDGFWGKGKTVKEAKSNLQWSPSKHGTIWSVHPEAYVNDFAQLCRPQGTQAPEVIGGW